MTHDHGLTPGSIDGAARTAFRYGGCGALAIAIHDATGWPIAAITDHDNVYDGRIGMGSALHWTVLHPSGQMLDIEGLHDTDTLTAEYHFDADDEQAAWGLASRESAVEWYEEAGATIPLELAASFVSPLLASLAPAGE
jgi:hypothetical protein